MPLVIVTSVAPGQGKSTVASAIARHFAYQGRPVRLFRLASELAGSNADQDARAFAGYFFAPGSPSAPIAGDHVADPGGNALDVIEADASLLAANGAKVVAVGTAPAVTPGLAALKPVAYVQLRAANEGVVSEEAGGIPVIRVGEDATLNGPSVAEIQAALHADTLVEGDDPSATCDNLVIAPIASDAGQPYFRRFRNMGVLVRFDKTDQHLAAMQAEPVCLVLTGGRRPSDYLFDAATAKGVPVLLSRTDTENTAIALERIYERTRFSGERKLDHISELLAGTPLFAALA